MTRLDARIRAYWARIEQVLDRCLVLPEPGSARLREAMRYRTLGRGKRVRPLLLNVEGHAQLLGKLISVRMLPARSPPTPAPRGLMAHGHARLSCVTVPSQISVRCERAPKPWAILRATQ